MTFYLDYRRRAHGEHASWADSCWGGGDAQRPHNLNDLIIRSADGPDECLRDRPAAAQSGVVETVFHGLEARLCAEIMKWPYVFGCMAWLTNVSILKALATRRAVSLIVQKEDFLRPDNGGPDKQRLRSLYYALPTTDRWGLDVGYNTCGDSTLPAVMCAGYRGETQRKAVPRMHHKFLVFCELGLVPDNWSGSQQFREAFIPRMVWTGSFNATENGEKSLENAVLIKDDTIAAAYLREFQAILGVAECLNWESQWVCPEYRIGT